MKNYGNMVMMAGHLDMRGQSVKNMVLGQDTDNVSHPVPGRVARVGNRLLFCLDVYDNQPLWVPLMQERNVYIHDQTASSSTWTINHNMNSARVIVQVFSATNQAIIPDTIEPISNDTVEVTFTQSVTGHAIVMVGNIDGAQKPDVRFEQSFTSQTTMTVNHNLGYEPVIRVISESGFEVLPQSVQHTTLNQAVLTFSSAVTAKVICV